MLFPFAANPRPCTVKFELPRMASSTPWFNERFAQDEFYP
jgi:hypothetical protein